MQIPLLRGAALAAALSLLAACGQGDAETARAGAASGADTVPAPVDTAARFAEQPAPSQPPAPRAPRDEAPAQIRGLYVNAYAAGSRNRLPKLLEMARQTEINAFVVDVKDEKGIRYRTELPLPKELAQPGEVAIRDLPALMDSLRANDIYSIARIVVFKDPILSRARPDWSVRNPSGGLWADKAGNTWVSPWDERVWDYNLDIAEEVARAGFDEIQFDYVRFAEPYRSLPRQVHQHERGDRTDAIAAFLNEARRRLHPLGVTVTADVFGLSPNEARDVNIGQQWETISATTDHILPMMYPSHYFPTHLPGVTRPDMMPYETLYKSAGMARLRNDRMEEAGLRPARVIPWLQAFTATWVRNHQDYGPEQIRQQKQGVYDVGFDDWILWHPGSKYEHVLDGLERGETQSRRKAQYTPPPDVQAWVDRFDRQGVRAAREKAAAQARGGVVDPAASQVDSVAAGQAQP